MLFTRIFKTTTILIFTIFFIYLNGNSQASATNGGGKGNKSVPVAGVSLHPDTLKMNVNDKDVELMETIKPSNATNKQVTWSSSNTKVATVSGSGVVHSVSVGSTTITVTTKDGNFKARSKVIVSNPNIEVKGIYLNTNSLKLNINDKDTPLNATITPSNATNKNVTWTSSNPSVATVSSSGLVHPVKPGTATITVSTQDGNYKDKATVTVCDPNIAVSAVYLNPKLVTLTVDDEDARLKATIKPENATNQELTWLSFNPKVATISDGVVHAVSPGVAIVKVFTKNGHYDWSLITVCASKLVPVKSLSLNPKNVDMTLGGKDATLTATITPINATNKNVVWSTSDPSIATVKNGIVQAIGSGTAMITVSTEDGKLQDTAKVNVTVPVTGVTVDPNSLNLTVGGKDATLTATIAPSNASNQNFTWTTSDPSVATVENGIVHPVGPGKATITVTTEDGGFTDTATVVVMVPVSGVSLDPKSLDLTVGGKDATLAPTIAPSNASNKNVTWSTSEPSVATVNNGIVHPVGPGKATITVTTEDGGFTDTAAITVDVPVTGISLDPDTLDLIVGGKDATLTASVAPSNATNKNVTWSTSDSSIATVENGVVHPVGPGKAIITVTTEDGGFKDETTVTVTAPVLSVTLDPKTLNFNLGDADQTLTATMNPSNATNQNVSWSTSDPSVATVNNGMVHAVGVGQATITVSTVEGGFTDTAIVTVIDPDTLPPVTKNKMTPIFNDKNTYIIALTVTYTATDDKSGVKETLYRINGGTWQVYTNPFDVYAENTHTLEYYSIDKADNKEKINIYDFDKGTCSCSK
ncbi:Ig-like domain-containing protein [Peribacillus sp. NPDC097675]|uniref:Ig-like domain-containing protein n=1 Tax=Peribacillus sp. NPDC097675 TaxID=3390618 RepID=UPI003D088909